MKFKIGDKVIVSNHLGGCRDRIGKKGDVVKVCKSENEGTLYLIHFKDEDTNNYWHERWMWEEELTLIKKEN